jgi:hypothetical protein
VKILPLIIGLGLFLLLLSKVFVIKTINCTANGASCSAEIRNLLENHLNQSYFSLNRKNLDWSIGQIFPHDRLTYNFSYPNRLMVELQGVKMALGITVVQVPSLPNLSLDLFASSTESAQWSRPIPEIETFLKDYEGEPKKLWEDGHLTSDSSPSGTVKYIYSKLPSPEQSGSVYKMITKTLRYLENPQIYVLGDRIFLSCAGLPDIIIYADASLDDVESSLQSLDYLSTIKKDARVINLSFKHPIIK